MNNNAVIDLSIVIVSWNARAFLIKCLKSLEGDPLNKHTEIIVVDNASTDRSAEEVRAGFPNVKLIQNAKNLGFAKANNIGINSSSGRYVALVNSDVEILDNCLSKLVAYMDSHPEIGMLGPRILWSDRTLQSSCRRLPSLWNNICPALGLTTLFPKSRLFAGEHMFYFQYDEIRSVEVLVGCFMVARREAVKAVGLLDERFFIYAEDVDWSKRFGDAGWPIFFYPHAEAIHHGRSSSSKEPLRFTLEQEKSVLQYWQKHHSRQKVFAFRLIVLARHVIRLSVAFVRYFFSAGKRADLKEHLSRNLACVKLAIRPQA
jgi:GT2 family glycosyltransferase